MVKRVTFEREYCSDDEDCKRRKKGDKCNKKNGKCYMGVQKTELSGKETVELSVQQGRIRDFFRDCGIMDRPITKEELIECLKKLKVEGTENGLVNDSSIRQINKIITEIKDLEGKPNPTPNPVGYFGRFYTYCFGDGSKESSQSCKISLSYIIERISRSHILGTTVSGGSRNNKKTKRRKSRSNLRSKKSKTKRIRKIR